MSRFYAEDDNKFVFHSACKILCRGLMKGCLVWKNKDLTPHARHGLIRTRNTYRGFLALTHTNPALFIHPGLGG